MQRLFILGNGFDLSHGLKTSYEDFRNYLVKQYNYVKSCNNSIPGYNVIGSKEDIASLLVDYITRANNGELWKDMEQAIKRFPFYIENYFYEFSLEHILFLMACFIRCFDTLPVLFSEWVNSIEIKGINPKKSFQNCVNKETDLFLNFNYTNVLENVYGLSNICHIHGRQNERIILGHGLNLNEVDRETAINIGYMLWDEIDCGLWYAYKNLFKDTKKQIMNNTVFFDTIEKLNEVYSYGFSFSEPDLAYIEEICKKTDVTTTWFFSNYEDNVIQQQYQKIVYDSGFRGKIDFFEI